MNLSKDELLTLAEAAAALKVPKRWLYERTGKRAVPFYKIGRHIRFARPELLAWFEGHRVEMEEDCGDSEDAGPDPLDGDPADGPDLAPEDEAVAVA